jgi:Acyltransferase family
MEFTQEKTNVAKGVAICLMFSTHLYSFPDRILSGNYYIPLIPFCDIEFYAGSFGNICVSMFLFISGYGMFLGHARSGKTPLQYSLEKLKDFYITYWTYFLLFVPIGLIFFGNETLWNSNKVRYSADLHTFLEGFLGWSARYNSEWWFVRMFVLLLLFLSPIYIGLGKKNPPLLCLFSISLFLFSWILKIEYTDTFSFIFWQISFAVGIICARSKFFSSASIECLENTKIIWLFFGMLVFGIVRHRFGAKIDFLFVPFFVYLVVRIIEEIRASQLLAYIGKYSFPMWLVHSFFCYYYFQDFIYFPRWSPLIFILLMGTSTLSVIIIENFRLQLKGKAIKWWLRWQP